MGHELRFVPLESSLEWPSEVNRDEIFLLADQLCPGSREDTNENEMKVFRPSNPRHFFQELDDVADSKTISGAGRT